MHPWITATQFEGHIVRLEALDPLRHRAGLIAAGADASIWTYLRFPPGDTPAGMDAHMTELVRRRDAHEEVPYVMIRRATNTIVGVTRFIDIRPAHRGVEFGTWITPQAQGDGTNVESKLLMLSYAFEQLDCVRVQIKTDALNSAAQRSLVALGATFEGCLRNHLIRYDGRIRNSYLYSIVDHEWPDIKMQLLQRRNKRLANLPQTDTNTHT
ncbi:MAG: GNAT family N-acetyltransferase [Chloroflexi bacterium]|nr:GNAT family N-acetyltransferase [Chloroflexota bacterium]